MNALQIFPNIIGVLGLSGVAARVARTFVADPETESRLRES
jgi:hypothetical protein